MTSGVAVPLREGQSELGQRRVFTWGNVGSIRVYALTVTPDAAPEAEEPDRKAVSKIRASSLFLGFKSSRRPQLRQW